MYVNNMINVITSFFLSKIEDININYRNQELIDSLTQNVKSPFIEKVHLFIDDIESYNKLNSIFQNELENEKIKIIEIGKKPLYSDLFQYAIEQLQGKICMVTNSDIYINECDRIVLDLLHLKNQNLLFALTRHEYDMSCPLINDYHGSHDSFIFKSPLDNSFIQHIEFAQNNWGSEAKLLQELYKTNIKIVNPCKQIKIVHLHKSDIREQNRVWIAYHTPDNPGCHFPPIIITPTDYTN
jgi:hypothetical protein